MIQTPWAILLCKFQDDSSEPFPRTFYENLFTASGVGTQNMVDLFKDISHGTLDLSGSEVFGWYTLPHNQSDYVGSGANPSGRAALISWAQKAASDRDHVPFAQFFNVVVCMNVPTDLFGSPGGVVCDNGTDPVLGVSSMSPCLLGQEMGHGYGLAHSRAAGSTLDYRDSWDIMSTLSAYITPHPNYTQRNPRTGSPLIWMGPILNAANMSSEGWLDLSRVWQAGSNEFGATVELRPLNRRDLPGYLAAQVHDYFLEFRMNESWDAGIPAPTVLIHQFSGGHSYLVSGSSGGVAAHLHLTGSAIQSLGAGDYFQLGNIDNPVDPAGGIRIDVAQIDTRNRTATLRITVRHAQTPRSAGPIIPLGVGAAGEGVIGLLNGKVVIIPPRSPEILMMAHIGALADSHSIQNAAARQAVQRDSLTAIARQAQAALQALTAPQEPAKSLLTETLDLGRQLAGQPRAPFKAEGAAGSEL